MNHHSALCVGGPLHGQFVAATSNTMRVVKHPEQHMIYGHHDQAQFELWTYGTYFYEDRKIGGTPTPLWTWDGWIQ